MTAVRVVAIDGAGGTGKSTLAAGLARVLRLPYVNTGSMYRAVAAAAHRQRADVDDVATLVRLTEGLRFTLSDPPNRRLVVDGYDQDDLTALEVEATVSAVARHPAVRDLLRALQRGLGEAGAVMEGRDIGSVVFPDAAVKLFLVAPASERAERRAHERFLPQEAVAGSLEERDRRDAITNPCVPSEDAVVVDTGGNAIEQTLQRALEIISERAPWLLAGDTG